MTRRRRNPPLRVGYFWREVPRIEDGEAYYQRHMLVELTAPELREIEATQGPLLTRYKPCHWTSAHDYVKRGGLHGTGLYTERDWRGVKRVRYAQGEIVE